MYQLSNTSCRYTLKSASPLAHRALKINNIQHDKSSENGMNYQNLSLAKGSGNHQALKKRALDLILCFFIAPIALSLTLVFALAFWIVTKDSPIFIQQRVGRHKKLFNVVKLRTMRSGTQDRPTHEIASSQITRIGKLMRSSKVDELPQIINVVKGEMSLVGPRPCLPTQIELINRRDELGVYKLRPGITGKAQIQKIDMEDPLVLADIDRQYLVNNTVSGDLILLLKTLIGAGLGDRTK